MVGPFVIFSLVSRFFTSVIPFMSKCLQLTVTLKVLMTLVLSFFEDDIFLSTAFCLWLMQPCIKNRQMWFSLVMIDSVK